MPRRHPVGRRPRSRPRSVARTAFNADRLVVTLRNVLERQRLARMVETLKDDFGRQAYFGFIGSSH